jgi:uncharacterized protein (DUF1015 family)
MNTTKHTPGPWIDDGFDAMYPKERNVIARNEFGPLYITRTIGGLDEAEEEANSRLIAAAPDLLESAKLLIDSYDICRKDRTPDVIFERLRAAIDKATGKQP